MKKKFTLEIASPCSENFNKMIPNNGGSFCSSCAKNVIDLSRKTNSEVAKFISESKDTNICARIKASQLEEEFVYNEVSALANFKYAAVAASVLLVSNVTAQENVVTQTEINLPQPDYIVGKVSHTINEEIAINVKGKLLDASTNKPFNTKDYPDLTISIAGSQREVKVNSKKGEFLISILILKNSKTLNVTIAGDDYYLVKTIPFDIHKVKNNIFLQDIVILPTEMSKVEVKIMGGLGINYSR